MNEEMPRGRSIVCNINLGLGLHTVKSPQLLKKLPIMELQISFRNDQPTAT
jgi:hypothetical protein